MLKDFICPDSGSKIGDIIDLKDFGKYKIIDIENYYINENVTLQTEPLYKYILELTEKCTRDIKDLKKEVIIMNDTTEIDYGDYFDYEEDYEAYEKGEYLKCPNCGSGKLRYFKRGVIK